LNGARIGCRRFLFAWVVVLPILVLLRVYWQWHGQLLGRSRSLSCTECGACQHQRPKWKQLRLEYLVSIIYYLISRI